MVSSVKFLFGFVLILGMTSFYSHSGLSGVSADLTGYNCCDRKLADVKATGWDQCKAKGTFKSVSKCYQTDSGSFVSRYDYYECKTTGNIFLLVKHNCTGSPVPFLDSQMKFDVFNRFSGTACTLLPPPPPPTPAPMDSTTGGGSSDTTASGATTTTTTTPKAF